MQRSDATAARQQRLQAVNELMQVIGGCGRHFFRNDESIPSPTNLLYDRMELDARGRVWFVGWYRDLRTYTHYQGRWYRFSHGGTLRRLVEAFRNFIMTGKEVDCRRHFAWACDGDPWGYGYEAMQTVREAAGRLGIVRGDKCEQTQEPVAKISSE